jgi:hypothetical protein
LVLKRFWFSFEKSKQPNNLNLGCGITAYDLPDAQRFLREQVFPSCGELPVKEINEGVDVRTLDEKHVRPNMGNPAVRGVWFPLM